MLSIKNEHILHIRLLQDQNRLKVQCAVLEDTQMQDSRSGTDADSLLNYKKK